MSARAVPLHHVLSQTRKTGPGLETMTSDTLKQAARFWFGKTAANKFRKDECLRAWKELLQDQKRLEEGLRSLPEKESQVLAVCMRYGGFVSGPLLLTETLARGLVEKPKERGPIYGMRQDETPVQALCDKLLLVSPGGGVNRYSWGYYSYRLSFPDLAVLPGVRELIKPAGPLPWKATAPAVPPTVTSRRMAAEVVLDLWTIAQELGQAGTWKTNRGGALPKNLQNRLSKLFSWPEDDSFLPPSPEALGYEILRGLGAVEAEEGQSSIDLKAVEQHLRNPAEVQGWHWVRAWLVTRLWQDGIGVVPDRDNDRDPVRIEPGKLRKARELLVWALCRLAHAPEEWWDLETFLADLWSVAGEEVDFYWHGYSWEPEFKAARGKDNIPAGPARSYAFWLDDEGTWVANALLGTLAYLGLVERGQSGSRQKVRYCFRLTRLGKAVFGAPELARTEHEHDPKFLTVQPNFEVLLYLDRADASAVWPLAQMARRVSSASGLVQTFALTRESVYQALESGLKVEEIRRFLLEHSKTGLPANVDQSLAEWGQKREALVLRTDVLIGAFPPGDRTAAQQFPKGRPLSDQFLLLPRTAARHHQGHPLLNHRAIARPVWRVEEDGRVSVQTGADAVALARLGQFADPDGNGWKITAASVRRAREHGISAEQILGWLEDHLANALPAMLETAIRNWSSPGKVFLDNLILLQVHQPQACAMILASQEFQPLLLGHVPPNWFIVRPERREELERLLAELGFSVGGSYKLTGLSEEEPSRTEGRRERKRKGR